MNGDVIGNDNDEHDVELCKLVLKSENSKLNLPQLEERIRASDSTAGGRRTG